MHRDAASTLYRYLFLISYYKSYFGTTEHQVTIESVERVMKRAMEIFKGSTDVAALPTPTLANGRHTGFASVELKQTESAWELLWEIEPDVVAVDTGLDLTGAYLRLPMMSNMAELATLLRNQIIEYNEMAVEEGKFSNEAVVTVEEGITLDFDGKQLARINGEDWVGKATFGFLFDWGDQDYCWGAQADADAKTEEEARAAAATSKEAAEAYAAKKQAEGRGEKPVSIFARHPDGSGRLVLTKAAATRVLPMSSRARDRYS